MSAYARCLFRQMRAQAAARAAAGAYALPVQHCHCGAPGERVWPLRRLRGEGLLYDARCTACGCEYTSTPARMVLRALTAHPIPW